MKSITNLVRRLVATGSFLAVVASAHAQFTTLPIYESFSEYPSGDKIAKGDASSGAFWTTGNSAGSSSPVVTNSAVLFYPGLLPDPAGTNAEGIIAQTTVGTGRNVTAPFTPITNGTIYESFLLNIQTLPSGPRSIVGLYGGTSSTPSATGGAAVWVNQFGQLQISKTAPAATGPPATNTTTPLTLNTSYLVVLSYAFGTGPHQVSLWLNPTSLGGAAPAPTIFTTNNANAAMINEIALFASSGAPTMTNLLDDIRVDSTWAGVTTPSCSPGPVFSVTGGGTGCPGTTFDVSLSGSVSSNAYLLYTNGVYSGEMVAGTGNAVSFGMQSTSGTYVVLATNTDGCAAWMNGTVNIGIISGPVITTQPLAALVATGNEAIFNATVSGVNLSYQWFKNGGPLSDDGHISGSTTPTLIISPASSGDAATAANGYYLVISNTCGLTATSTTNSLTLDVAANLVWEGNNPNSNWDLATTANFSNGGATTVFNAGDNVTFGDTSAEQTVNVIGNLPVGTVTDSSGSSYLITGNGTLAGTGSFVMTGGGLIALNTANSFSGGSTINSGTVSLQSFGGLGTGTITLAGGTLDVTNSGSAVLGVTNNINLTADSRLTFDKGGSFGMVIFGAVTGNPGTTMDLYTPQIPTAPARVRFYNTNFVENGNINLDSPYFQLSPYNASGTQTYNGLIVGQGSILTRQGGGTILLNGANTFTGGVALSAGATGLGVDTVVSSGTIVSGPLGTGNINLTLDGTATAASTANATLFASGGAHTVANSIVYSNTLTSFTFIINGSNSLTLSGGIDLGGQDFTGGSNRVFQIDNTNSTTTFSGIVSDDSVTFSTPALACGLTKTGAGVLALTAANSYEGSTTVSNGTLLVNGSIDTNAVMVAAGTLGGSGTINGAVTVAGTLAPGNAGIGTLTITKSLTLLAGSTTSIEVNKDAGTHDLVTGLPSVTYAGTLNAGNLSGNLSVGDTFPIFNTAAHTGNFSAITGSAGSGKGWSFDASTGVLSVISMVTVATNSTNITFTASNNMVTLNWPADHTGWILQAQTNALGIGVTTNWVAVAGSTNSNQFTSPITTNGNVFYRMVYP